MTRSVVAAWAANGEKASAPRIASTGLANTGLANTRPANKRLARVPKKAIPRRNSIPYRLPFLSCRCAVIVGGDKHPSRGHWTQPRAVLVGIRLRPWPDFNTQGFFHDFRLTPCSGDARRHDVVGRTCFRANAAAAAAPAAGAADARAGATAAAAGTRPRHQCL